jgi:hypothetical protein
LPKNSPKEKKKNNSDGDPHDLLLFLLCERRTSPGEGLDCMSSSEMHSKGLWRRRVFSIPYFSSKTSPQATTGRGGRGGGREEGQDF